LRLRFVLLWFNSGTVYIAFGRLSVKEPLGAFEEHTSFGMEGIEVFLVSLTSLPHRTSMSDTVRASSCSFPYSAARLRCTLRLRQMQQGRQCSADWHALDSASVRFPLRWVRYSYLAKQLTWFQSGFRPTRCFGRSLRRSSLDSQQMPFMNRQARLAMRLMTLMLALFGVMVWVPHLIAHPKAHFNWSECILTLLVTGAAWVVADLKSF
jgi:hypothetical protein